MRRFQIDGKDEDMDYSYHVYGLNIRSEIELPEIDAPAQGRTDVVIRRRAVQNKPDSVDSASWGCYHATSSTANLYYPQVGFFEIANGKSISLEPIKGTPSALIRHAILSVAMSIILDQRGYLTFNGSAVNLGGEVVSFLGGKHLGKTAIAAAFYLKGFPVVTDNTLALHPDSVTTVLPGFPWLKLRPETVSETPGLNGERLDDFAGNRKMMRVERGFTPSPLPLKHIFILDWGDRIEVEHLSLRDSFMLLIQHSYALRFLGKAGATAKHFTRVNQLVHNIPISYLRRPRDFRLIPELVDYVAGELDAESPVRLN